MQRHTHVFVVTIISSDEDSAHLLICDAIVYKFADTKARNYISSGI